jgi:hypothetical protein
MRLRDLDPHLNGTVSDGVLSFNCPHPGCEHSVRVSISSAPYHERPPRGTMEMMQKNGMVKVWQASGEFPDSLSLAPSIDIIEADAHGNKIRTLCWHGFVTNGDVT